MAGDQFEEIRDAVAIAVLDGDRLDPRRDPEGLPAFLSCVRTALSRLPNGLCGRSSEASAPSSGTRWQVRQSLSFRDRPGPR